MRAFLRALCRDALSCALEAPAARSVLAPGAGGPDSGGLTPLDAQGAAHARNTLFQLLGQPRSLDATSALFEAKPPFEVCFSYSVLL